MRSGNLQSTNGQLQEALEALEIAWSHTAEHWRDQNAQRVEEEHLNPIAEELTKSLPAISHMAQLLNQAARDLDE